METYLYRPGSRMAVGNGEVQVSVIWIPLRAERIRLAPYPVLIRGYGELSVTEASVAKGYIDEFFSLTELNQFKAYMEEERGITLKVERISVPLECRDRNGSMALPFRCRNEDDGWCSLCLDGRDRMDLPFDVSGYYRWK